MLDDNSDLEERLSAVALPHTRLLEIDGTRLGRAKHSLFMSTASIKILIFSLAFLKVVISFYLF